MNVNKVLLNTLEKHSQITVNSVSWHDLVNDLIPRE